MKEKAETPNNQVKIKAVKKKHINLELNLNKPYAEIQKMYSENLHRNLKKIPDTFFSIRHEDKIENLIQIFRDNNETKIGTLPRDFYAVLRNIAEAAGRQSCGELWHIYSSGKLQAGILFVTGCGRAVFLFLPPPSVEKITMPCLISSIFSSEPMPAAN